MQNQLKLLSVLFVSQWLIVQVAMAELSANVGLVSEYHFRGVQQTDDASASAGLDYENAGFNIGVWTADVGDGLEIDLYGGYSFDLGSEASASIGVTTYQYTGDFDSAYNEVNLGLSYSMFSLEYTIGTRDDDIDLGIAESDYTFLAISVEYEGFYGQFGTFGNDADGEYFEVGYGTDVNGFDIGMSMIFASDELSVNTPPTNEETIVFSVSKAFEL